MVVLYARSVTLYDVLGVAPTADDTTVRRAYLSLARRHHPDLAGGDPARMQAVNDAWATLGDPVRRARYDESLGAARPSAPPSHAEQVWETRDERDDLDDLDDDRAVRATVKLPRWLSLLPVALFAMSVATGFLGMLFVSQATLGLALVELILSCLFFLAAPFIALFASRSGDVGSRSPQ